jgi:hypothetical protein
MQTNPKEKPNQTIDRNRRKEHKRRRCDKIQARKSTCKNRSPIRLCRDRQARCPQGFSPTALDARHTTTATTTVHSRGSFRRWADMRNRRNPLRVPWRFIQDVSPRFPTHQIPGSITYNHGSHLSETRRGTGIAFTRPGGSLILIFQSPENGGY